MKSATVTIHYCPHMANTAHPTRIAKGGAHGFGFEFWQVCQFRGAMCDHGVPGPCSPKLTSKTLKLTTSLLRAPLAYHQPMSEDPT